MVAQSERGAFAVFQIAVGFAKSQGLSALWLGILRSIGGAFGIIGANLYTFIETRSSARKSGVVGMIVSFSLYRILFFYYDTLKNNF